MTEGESDLQAVQRLVQNRQRYLKHPYFCPFCEHTEITGHQAEFDADYAWRSVTCDKCDAEWRDVFEIVGIE